jgi:uncharacterized BrkB/YihY/UPF0761 family membrane protein
METLKRTVTEFREDNLTDWAAALTYYGLLALFPALIALVAVVGLVADPASTTEELTAIVTRIGPDSAAQTFAEPIESITSNRGASGVLVVAGLAVALWSASSYVGAFIRASNVIYETPEGRPFSKLRPLQLLVTLITVVVLALVAVAAWLLASAAFALYVANFGSYDKTYGTLGGVVVLLVRMWITNMALLFGHQLNAERERSAELAEGTREARHEIQREPRSAPKAQTL